MLYVFSIFYHGYYTFSSLSNTFSGLALHVFSTSIVFSVGSWKFPCSGKTVLTSNEYLLVVMCRCWLEVRGILRLMQHGHADPRVQARPAQAYQIIPGISSLLYIRFTYLTLSVTLRGTFYWFADFFPHWDFPAIFIWWYNCRILASLRRRRQELKSRTILKNIFSLPYPLPSDDIVGSSD